MARVQSADYDQRRDLILRRATRLYASHGFGGSSIADIAKACKISKALIYHYFSSKEDILFEAVDSHIRVMLEATQRIASTHAAPTEKLKALSHAYLHLYATALDRNIILINDLNHLPKAKRDQIVSRQLEVVHLIRDIIAEIQPELAERGGRLLTPTTMIFLGMINWTHFWFDSNGPASIDEFADLLTSVMLNGIAPMGKASLVNGTVRRRAKRRNSASNLNA
jgi:AcrR family transcriptional regulator